MTSDSEQFSKNLSALQALCSKREYCIQDIRKKALERLEANAEESQRLIDSLIEDGFIDEHRYASAFAREKSSISGWGPIKIRYTLIKKGIPSQIISQALEECDKDKSQEKLKKVLESKWKSLCSDPYAKLKLIRFALTRGYDYESVRDLIDEIVG